MDLYIMSLVLGAAGLGTMALSGLGARGGGGHGHAGGGHAGGGHAGGGHAGVGHAHVAGHGHGHGVGHGHGAAHGHLPGMTGRALLAIASPRFLFSLLLGFGTSGELLRPFLGGPLHFVAALAGGVLFERALVSPLWNFMMRFASRPAVTLESSVSDDATAVTSFDENGQGIVSIELDGQVVQILATLRPDDRLLGGARVRAGQLVRIEAVNAEQNRCTVSII